MPSFKVDMKCTGLTQGLFPPQTSKTFPSLCRATLETTIAHLAAVARVTTIDYNGVFQERGGDPVTAELRDDVGEMVS